jgi:hypothetical protein
MLAEPILVVARVAQAFDALGVSYVVGGSLASSVYGIPRATQDVDLVLVLVADLKEPDVERLVQLLSTDFYIDADMIREAIGRRASFNVIHLATMFKADVFVLKRDAWSREEMSRAREERLEGPQGPVTIRFASPEDTLLHKLVWYKLGNEISDRQWSDILGILKVQRVLLDGAYLDRWAPLLDVASLLARARSQQ